MKSATIATSIFLISFSSASLAKLSEPTAATAQARHDRADLATWNEENEIMCADQALKIVDQVGDGSDRATEFRLFMSIKCGQKAKKGILFGANAAPERSAKAIQRLRNIYPRVKTAEGQRRLRDFVEMLQRDEGYPEARVSEANAAAGSAR